MSIYMEGILMQMGINILMAYSAFIILATGQLSLGNAGFMAIGAFCSGYLTVRLGIPLPIALILSALLSSLVGVALGIPVLRIRGFFLVLGTLGFGETVRAFFINFEPTGGAYGMRGLFGTTFEMVLLTVVAVTIGLWRIEQSRIGRAFDAVAADEDAAQGAGVNVRAVKVMAFGIGAFIAGLAGGLSAHHLLYVEPGHFSFLVSAMAVLFVILGGMQTFWGAMLGAVIFSLLPEMLRFMEDWRLSVYGAALIILMILRPNGLLSRVFLRNIAMKFQF
ncbi:MAG: branched-chain amino acid ABC transporter permease [Rhodospirillales bacterium]|jgi:branched-chain amino acid transport system permease protein|nr:branched-chain amino acid ABC transporter permease [Alphaproteobacteria bacterium]MDP7625590.1 branched-chain amino acid ABC transporter permease [Rhodospirillales bacterium]|tara:strand:- start:137 stop:970 length:834 start_codon:yes stop_codon:yes gene_type:complete